MTVVFDAAKVDGFARLARAAYGPVRLLRLCAWLAADDGDRGFMPLEEVEFSWPAAEYLGEVWKEMTTWERANVLYHLAPGAERAMNDRANRLTQAARAEEGT